MLPVDALFHSQVVKCFCFPSFFFARLRSLPNSSRFADAVDSCEATNDSRCSVALRLVACMEYVTGDVYYVSRTLEVRHAVQPLNHSPTLRCLQLCSGTELAVALFIYCEVFYLFADRGSGNGAAVHV